MNSKIFSHAKTSQGFTLYEIIIYLAIIGVFFGVVIPTASTIISIYNNQKNYTTDQTELLFVLQKIDYLFRTLKPVVIQASDTMLYFNDTNATTSLGVDQGNFFIDHGAGHSNLTDLSDAVNDFSVQHATSSLQQSLYTTINFTYKKQSYTYVYVSQL